MGSVAELAVDGEQSLELCRRAGALLTGHFRLTSGLHSDQYFQCATLMEDPKVGEQIAAAVAGVCRGWNVDVVVAPALGAILFGYELARQLGVRNIFVERPEGKFEFRRGFGLRSGERVLIAENVITTGGSAIETAELVRSVGGVVAGYALIVDRSGGRFAPPEPVAAYAGFQAKVFQPEECPLCQVNIPITKPGSRAIG